VLKYEIGNFKSWLHVLTKNHCLMILRSASFRQELQSKDISSFAVESMEFAHHDNGTAIESDLIQLKKCMETLNNEQKTCVRMFFLEQHSYRQIAEKTDFDLKKVKSHIQNGKRNLKNCMEQNREE
jgi:RNA polymerase sigma-70 factor (ECF subfamily)